MTDNRVDPEEPGSPGQPGQDEQVNPGSPPSTPGIVITTPVDTLHEHRVTESSKNMPEARHDTEEDVALPKVRSEIALEDEPQVLDNSDAENGEEKVSPVDDSFTVSAEVMSRPVSPEGDDDNSDTVSVSSSYFSDSDSDEDEEREPPMDDQDSFTGSRSGSAAREPPKRPARPSDEEIARTGSLSGERQAGSSNVDDDGTRGRDITPTGFFPSEPFNYDGRVAHVLQQDDIDKANSLRRRSQEGIFRKGIAREPTRQKSPLSIKSITRSGDIVTIVSPTLGEVVIKDPKIAEEMNRHDSLDDLPFSPINRFLAEFSKEAQSVIEQALVEKQAEQDGVIRSEMERPGTPQFGESSSFDIPSYKGTSSAAGLPKAPTPSNKAESSSPRSSASGNPHRSHLENERNKLIREAVAKITDTYTPETPFLSADVLWLYLCKFARDTRLKASIQQKELVDLEQKYDEVYEERVKINGAFMESVELLKEKEAEHGQEVTTLQVAVAKAEETIKGLESELLEAKNRPLPSSESNALVQSSSDKALQEADEKIERYLKAQDQRLNAARKTAEAYEAHQDAIKKSLDKEQADKKKLESEITKLTQENETLKAKTQELQTEIEGNQNEISIHENRNDILNTENARLIKENSRLEAENTKLKASKTQLEAEKIELETAKAQLEDYRPKSFSDKTQAGAESDINVFTATIGQQSDTNTSSLAALYERSRKDANRFKGLYEAAREQNVWSLAHAASEKEPWPIATRSNIAKLIVFMVNQRCSPEPTNKAHDMIEQGKRHPELLTADQVSGWLDAGFGVPRIFSAIQKLGHKWDERLEDDILRALIQSGWIYGNFDVFSAYVFAGKPIDGQEFFTRLDKFHGQFARFEEEFAKKDNELDSAKEEIKSLTDAQARSAETIQVLAAENKEQAGELENAAAAFADFEAYKIDADSPLGKLVELRGEYADSQKVNAKQVADFNEQLSNVQTLNASLEKQISDLTAQIKYFKETLEVDSENESDGEESKGVCKIVRHRELEQRIKRLEEENAELNRLFDKDVQSRESSSEGSPRDTLIGTLPTDSRRQAYWKELQELRAIFTQHEARKAELPNSPSCPNCITREREVKRLRQQIQEAKNRRAELERELEKSDESCQQRINELLRKSKKQREDAEDNARERMANRGAHELEKQKQRYLEEIKNLQDRNTSLEARLPRSQDTAAEVSPSAAKPNESCDGCAVWSVERTKLITKIRDLEAESERHMRDQIRVYEREYKAKNDIARLQKELDRAREDSDFFKGTASSTKSTPRTTPQSSPANSPEKSKDRAGRDTTEELQDEIQRLKNLLSTHVAQDWSAKWNIAKESGISQEQEADFWKSYKTESESNALLEEVEKLREENKKLKADLDDIEEANAAYEKENLIEENLLPAESKGLLARISHLQRQNQNLIDDRDQSLAALKHFEGKDPECCKGLIASHMKDKEDLKAKLDKAEQELDKARKADSSKVDEEDPCKDIKAELEIHKSALNQLRNNFQEFIKKQDVEKQKTEAEISGLNSRIKELVSAAESQKATGQTGEDDSEDPCKDVKEELRKTRAELDAALKKQAELQATIQKLQNAEKLKQTDKKGDSGPGDGKKDKDASKDNKAKLWGSQHASQALYANYATQVAGLQARIEELQDAMALEEIRNDKDDFCRDVRKEVISAKTELKFLVSAYKKKQWIKQSQKDASVLKTPTKPDDFTDDLCGYVVRQLADLKTHIDAFKKVAELEEKTSDLREELARAQDDFKATIMPRLNRLAVLEATSDHQAIKDLAEARRLNRIQAKIIGNRERNDLNRISDLEKKCDWYKEELEYKEAEIDEITKEELLKANKDAMAKSQNRTYLYNECLRLREALAKEDNTAATAADDSQQPDAEDTIEAYLYHECLRLREELAKRADPDAQKTEVKQTVRKWPRPHASLLSMFFPQQRLYEDSPPPSPDRPTAVSTAKSTSPKSAKKKASKASSDKDKSKTSTDDDESKSGKTLFKLTRANVIYLVNESSDARVEAEKKAKKLHDERQGFEAELRKYNALLSQQVLPFADEAPHKQQGARPWGRNPGEEPKEKYVPAEDAFGHKMLSAMQEKFEAEKRAVEAVPRDERKYEERGSHFTDPVITGFWNEVQDRRGRIPKNARKAKKPVRGMVLQYWMYSSPLVALLVGLHIFTRGFSTQVFFALLQRGVPKSSLQLYVWVGFIAVIAFVASIVVLIISEFVALFRAPRVASSYDSDSDSDDYDDDFDLGGDGPKPSSKPSPGAKPDAVKSDGDKKLKEDDKKPEDDDKKPEDDDKKPKGDDKKSENDDKKPNGDNDEDPHKDIRKDRDHYKGLYDELLQREVELLKRLEKRSSKGDGDAQVKPDEGEDPCKPVKDELAQVKKALEQANKALEEANKPDKEPDSEDKPPAKRPVDQTGIELVRAQNKARRLEIELDVCTEARKADHDRSQLLRQRYEIAQAEADRANKRLKELIKEGSHEQTAPAPTPSEQATPGDESNKDLQRRLIDVTNERDQAQAEIKRLRTELDQAQSRITTESEAAAEGTSVSESELDQLRKDLERARVARDHLAAQGRLLTRLISRQRALAIRSDNDDPPQGTPQVRKETLDKMTKKCNRVIGDWYVAHKKVQPLEARVRKLEKQLKDGQSEDALDKCNERVAELEKKARRYEIEVVPDLRSKHYAARAEIDRLQKQIHDCWVTVPLRQGKDADKIRELELQLTFANKDLDMATRANQQSHARCVPEDHFNFMKDKKEYLQKQLDTAEQRLREAEKLLAQQSAGSAEQSPPANDNHVITQQLARAKEDLKKMEERYSELLSANTDTDFRVKRLYWQLRGAQTDRLRAQEEAEQARTQRDDWQRATLAELSDPPAIPTDNEDFARYQRLLADRQSMLDLTTRARGIAEDDLKWYRDEMTRRTDSDPEHESCVQKIKSAEDLRDSAWDQLNKLNEDKEDFRRAYLDSAAQAEKSEKEKNDIKKELDKLKGQPFEKQTSSEGGYRPSVSIAQTDDSVPGSDVPPNDDQQDQIARLQHRFQNAEAEALKLARENERLTNQLAQINEDNAAKYLLNTPEPKQFVTPPSTDKNKIRPPEIFVTPRSNASSGLSSEFGSVRTAALRRSTLSAPKSSICPPRGPITYPDPPYEAVEPLTAEGKARSEARKKHSPEVERQLADDRARLAAYRTAEFEFEDNRNDLWARGWQALRPDIKVTAHGTTAATREGEQLDDEADDTPSSGDYDSDVSAPTSWAFALFDVLTGWWRIPFHSGHREATSKRLDDEQGEELVSPLRPKVFINLFGWSKPGPIASLKRHRDYPSLSVDPSLATSSRNTETRTQTNEKLKNKTKKQVPIDIDWQPPDLPPVSDKSTPLPTPTPQVPDTTSPTPSEKANLIPEPPFIALARPRPGPGPTTTETNTKTETRTRPQTRAPKAHDDAKVVGVSANEDVSTSLWGWRQAERHLFSVKRQQRREQLQGEDEVEGEVESPGSGSEVSPKNVGVRWAEGLGLGDAGGNGGSRLRLRFYELEGFDEEEGEEGEEEATIPTPQGKHP